MLAKPQHPLHEKLCAKLCSWELRVQNVVTSPLSSKARHVAKDKMHREKSVTIIFVF